MTPLPWGSAWAEKPRLLRVARGRSLDHAEAEDVVHEAIVRCVTHPNLDPARLPAMLTAVTMRICVDRLRERLAAERAMARLGGDTPCVDVDDVLDAAEATWLAAETARLAGREHAALTARALGLTTAETAVALGVSYKAAESALDRARRKLRAAWAATLGVVAWLRARLRPAVPTAALAGVALVTASVAVLVLPVRPPDRAPATPRIDAAAYAEENSGRVPRAAPRPAPTTPAPLTRVAPVPSGSPDDPDLSTPPLGVGPVEHDPTLVWFGDEPAVERVQECAANGVEVVVGTTYTAVTCREDS